MSSFRFPLLVGDTARMALNAINKVSLVPPYLLFVGDQAEPTNAKTALGIVHWRRELVAGQLRLGAEAVDLGVPDLDLDAAIATGVKSLLIGVAPVGGAIPEAWWGVIIEAAGRGLHIVSGLHARLSDNPELVIAAQRSGSSLIDIRVPPRGIPVGSGRKRSGRRVLMSGTDCAVGKKYSRVTGS